MSDERKLRRVEKLLAIGRSQEQAARQAFDRARAASEDIRARLAECEREIVVRHDQARERLLAGGQAELAQPYRDGVATLRRKIEKLAARRKAAAMRLENRRADLLAAMTRRRAAQIVRERLAARQASAEARKQTRQLDEAHAAAVAAGETRRADPAGIERQQA